MEKTEAIIGPFLNFNGTGIACNEGVLDFTPFIIWLPSHSLFMCRLIIVLVILFLPFFAQAAGVDMGAASLRGRDLHGREVYVQSCAMCHANGVGGAPRPGRAEDWAERNKKGPADLLVSVLRGKGGMPPKGGNASLTRAEVYVAMDYMLNELK